MPRTTVTFLEMQHRDELNGPSVPGVPLDLREVTPKDWRWNKELYVRVGRPWHWTDRLDWSEAEWRAVVEQSNFRTWVLYVQDTPAGFVELRRKDGQAVGAGPAVEIVSFGLTPPWIGQGLGAAFLTQAVEVAWDWQAGRVWLHTNTLDHPAALQNYLRRGFQIVRTEEKGEDSDCSDGQQGSGGV